MTLKFGERFVLTIFILDKKYWSPSCRWYAFPLSETENINIKDDKVF